MAAAAAGQKEEEEEEDHVRVPHSVQVTRFVQARRGDVDALLAMLQRNQARRPRQRRRPARAEEQGLPGRRRTASHRRYRLPVQLRMGLVEGRTRKRPRRRRNEAVEDVRCRKHRRRPHTLLQARNLHDHFRPRAGEESSVPASWLETHVWHAKRMHMVTLWDLRLPRRHAARGAQAACRAMREGCVVHDASYWRPLHLLGPPAALRALLQRTTNPSHPKLWAADVLRGDTEVYAQLHEMDRYPAACIGPICLLWSPCSKGGAATGGTTEMLLFVHAACAAETWDVLRRWQQEAGDDYSGRVWIRWLPDGANRFHLRGVAADDALEASGLLDDAACRAMGLPKNQAEGRTVAILRVEGVPRTNEEDDEQQQRKDEDKFIIFNNHNDDDDRDGNTTDSALRASDVRNWPWISDSQRRGMRSSVERLSAAGTGKLPPVPPALMLIRRTASGATIPGAAGWDVLVPAGYGRSVWNRLTRWGAARAIGLEEQAACDLDVGRPRFPEDYPETQAGSSTLRGLLHRHVVSESPNQLRSDLTMLRDPAALSRLRPANATLRASVGPHVLGKRIHPRIPLRPRRQWAKRPEPKRWVVKGSAPPPPPSPPTPSPAPALALDQLLTVWLDMPFRGALTGRPRFPCACSIHAPTAADSEVLQPFLAENGETRRRRLPGGASAASAAATATAAGHNNDSGGDDDVCISGQREILGFVTAGHFSRARGRVVGIGIVSAARMHSLVVRRQEPAQTQGWFVLVHNAGSTRLRVARIAPLRPTCV